MSFPSSSPAAANLLADKGWRRRHSAWLLAPILGCGMLSFVGFVYVAIRVQTRKFWAAAAISSAGSAAIWVAMALSGDLSETGESSTDTTSDWSAGLAVAVWVALLVYGFVLNRDYLRWRAGLTESSAWYNQPTTSTSSGDTQAPVVNGLDSNGPGFLGVNQSDYFAAAPTPSAPATPAYPPHPVRPAPQPPVQNPPPQSGDPVDVNHATAYSLAHTLGIEPILASRVIAVRDSRGGFVNLDDMVSSAGLQPHELLKFRNRVTFGAPAARPPGPSTSAAPPPTDGPSGGRILDI